MTDKAAKAAREERRAVKAREAATRGAARKAKKAKLDAQTAAITSRLDRLKQTTPDLSAKWQAERAEEKKTLKKIKDRLAKRTTKDIANRFIFEALPTLPEPVAQPDFSKPDPVEAPPPREGLIPGTFKLIDPNRIAPLLDADPLPKRWTARHVGVRLIEAMEVLKILPGCGNGGSSSVWPAYLNEGVELAYQAGAGTLAIGRNNVRRIASANEVARMNEAITWPMQYLSGCNFWSLGALNEWAIAGDPDSKDAPNDLLQFIAEALNAAKEVVR